MIDYRPLEELDCRMSTFVEDLKRLLEQLAGNPIKASPEYFGLVARRSTWLAAFAEGGGKIVGMVALAPVYIPTGFHGLVEDMVVSNDYSGRGIDFGLMTTVIKMARNRGMLWLIAPTKPGDKAANERFRKFGFTPDPTGNFRLVLSP